MVKKYIINYKFIKASKLDKFGEIYYCYGVFWDVTHSDTNILPSNVIRLTFDGRFNFNQLINIPASVTHLIFSKYSKFN